MIKEWVRYKDTIKYLPKLPSFLRNRTMTTTTYPLHKITEALDILQEHGVLEDNTADHALGCWLEENENISISDAEWSRFVDGCNDAFADACGEIATEVWESNNHNYTYTQNWYRLMTTKLTTKQQAQAIKDLWSSTMTTEDLMDALLEAYTEGKESYIDELYFDLIETNWTKPLLLLLLWLNNKHKQSSFLT